jgi:hypothetical protein
LEANVGRASREKGKRGERECAAELATLLGVAARRGVQFHGGPDSPDVVIDAAIHVEAKRVESLQLYPAVEQATNDAPAGRVPIVWHRRNNKPSVVIVETARLVDLARAIAAAAEPR